MLRVRNIAETHFAPRLGPSSSSSDVETALASVGAGLHSAEEVERAVELQASSALVSGVSTTAPMTAITALLATTIELCTLEASHAVEEPSKPALRPVTRLDRLRLKARLLEMLQQSREDTEKLEAAEDWMAGGVEDRLGEELQVVVDPTSSAAASVPLPSASMLNEDLEDSDRDSDDVDAVVSEEEDDEVVVDPLFASLDAPKRSRKSPTARARATQDDGNEAVFQRYVREYYARALGLDSEDDLPDHPERKLKCATIGDGLRIPAELAERLFPYQVKGVHWMWGLHRAGTGGILADEMGLGKTAQVVSLFAGLRIANMLGPSLIVCPATLMTHWTREFKLWFPPIRVLMLHEAGESKSVLHMSVPAIIDLAYRSSGVLLLTYSGLRCHGPELLKRKWSYAVLDEGHHIRNHSTETTLLAKQLKTVHRLILTGSPIQNNLRELWSLFDFVFPERLGTLKVFDAKFAAPIAAGGYSGATSLQVQTAYQCAVLLRELISPYLLRRLKKDVNAQLPKKTEQVLTCSLTSSQRAVYRNYLRSREVADVLDRRAPAFRAIGFLRKICNHPDLFLKKMGRDIDGRFGDPEKSGKLKVAATLLRALNKDGNKVLFFCQGTQMLNVVEDYIKSEGYTYLRMDGETPVRQRQKLVDQFNGDGTCFLFLLTTRVGGLGVNLTGANFVIIFDPDWNPITDVQARERAWRLGQKREVTIYRLITSGTIEEKVYQRQIFKHMLTKRILVDPRQSQSFSTRDLQDLFTLSEGGLPDKALDIAAVHVAPASENKKRKRKAEPDDADGEDPSKSGTAKLLSAIFNSGDLKDVFSHDVIEGLGAAGSDSGAIRAEAYKAAREAKQALLSRTLSAPSRPVAPAPPPRFILFGAATSSAAMSSTWARRTVACKSPACVSLRKRGKAKRACGVCSSLPNCALNYQPFGRNYFRSSFLIRSHVSLYEATELEGVVSSEPSAMLGGAPLTAVYSKVTRHPGPKSVRTVTLGVRPAPHLSAQLTRSLTDGTAAYFGGTSTSQMTPGGQGCPPSSLLLARMRDRQRPVNAAVATIPSHRDDIAAVSTLMVKVIDILKSKKGVMTTAAVFAKFTSLGLLATEKQGIEFREALQAVAHCDNSVWTLKKEFWK